MPTVSDWGTIDGAPAKIVYNSTNGKKDIYWGGRGAPDGPGHNHAVVFDSNPHATAYIRINGKVVADDRAQSRFQKDLAKRGGWLGVFREAFGRAMRFNNAMYNLGGKKKRRRW
jgi:hypothetical protein